MPTIPLYSQTAHPDAWHRVQSPGGYEWWHFEARSLTDDRVITARLSRGLPFARDYVRQYLRYRRHPTRVPPPAAGDFVEVSASVVRNGAVEWASATRCSGADFIASEDRPDVRVGASSWNGSVLSLSGTDLGGQRMSAQLTFLPRAAGAISERQFMPQSFVGQHRWIIAGGLCNVEGQVGIGSGATDFRGVGYRDHHYGTDLPAQSARRWFHGRAIGDDGSWCVAFHHVQQCDGRADAGLQLIEIDYSGAMAERKVEMQGVRWESLPRPTSFLLGYPVAARVGGALTLTRGRVVASSASDVRVAYDAEQGGRKGQALCTMTYPQRLRLGMR